MKQRADRLGPDMLYVNQAAESQSQKVIRHLRAGELDKETITRGIRMLLTPQVKDILDRKPSFFSSQSDWQNTGLDVTQYIFPSPNIETKQGFLSLRAKRSEHELVSATIVDLPRDVSLTLEVSPSALENGESYLWERTYAFATISGPTSSFSLPNNGFYYRIETDEVEKYFRLQSAAQIMLEVNKSDTPFNKSQINTGIFCRFQDTNPSGLRRGAIAISESSETHLVTDEKKWEIVRNNFEGYKSLIGTSTYFMPGDFMKMLNETRDTYLSAVSYLIEYYDHNGEQRWSHFHCRARIPRRLAFLTIAEHMERVRALWFQAHEMELLGSNCHVVKEGRTVRVTGEGDSRTRFDHYVFMKNQSQTR